MLCVLLMFTVLFARFMFTFVDLMFTCLLTFLLTIPVNFIFALCWVFLHACSLVSTRFFVRSAVLASFTKSSLRSELRNNDNS